MEKWWRPAQHDSHVKGMGPVGDQGEATDPPGQGGATAPPGQGGADKCCACKEKPCKMPAPPPESTPCPSKKKNKKMEFECPKEEKKRTKPYIMGPSPCFTPQQEAELLAKCMQPPPAAAAAPPPPPPPVQEMDPCFTKCQYSVPIPGDSYELNIKEVCSKREDNECNRECLPGFSEVHQQLPNEWSTCNAGKVGQQAQLQLGLPNAGEKPITPCEWRECLCLLGYDDNVTPLNSTTPNPEGLFPTTLPLGPGKGYSSVCVPPPPPGPWPICERRCKPVSDYCQETATIEGIRGDRCFACALAGMCYYGNSKSIPMGTNKITWRGYSWHEECFRCSHCNHVIGHRPFIPRGRSVYHQDCYTEAFNEISAAEWNWHMNPPEEARGGFLVHGNATVGPPANAPPGSNFYPPDCPCRPPPVGVCAEDCSTFEELMQQAASGELAGQGGYDLSQAQRIQGGTDSTSNETSEEADSSQEDSSDEDTETEKTNSMYRSGGADKGKSKSGKKGAKQGGKKGKSAAPPKKKGSGAQSSQKKEGGSEEDDCDDSKDDDDCDDAKDDDDCGDDAAGKQMKKETSCEKFLREEKEREKKRQECHQKMEEKRRREAEEQDRKERDEEERRDRRDREEEDRKDKKAREREERQERRKQEQKERKQRREEEKKQQEQKKEREKQDEEERKYREKIEKEQKKQEDLKRKEERQDRERQRKEENEKRKREEADRRRQEQQRREDEKNEDNRRREAEERRREQERTDKQRDREQQENMQKEREQQENMRRQQEYDRREQERQQREQQMAQQQQQQAAQQPPQKQ